MTYYNEQLLYENQELRERIERLEAELKTCCDHENIWKYAQEMGYTKVIDEQKAEIEGLRAVVDAARPIADNYTGFAGHIELIQALAALEGGDER
jgi:cell division septum initiation protein DivIVA